MRYTIRISAEFADELKNVRATCRARIRKAIGTLDRSAEVETKHRKRLDLSRLQMPLPFEHQPPVWQLSVGSWRVFYDVAGETVFVRALRFKVAHKITEEIL